MYAIHWTSLISVATCKTDIEQNLMLDFDESACSSRILLCGKTTLSCSLRRLSLGLSMLHNPKQPLCLLSPGVRMSQLTYMGLRGDTRYAPAGTPSLISWFTTMMEVQACHTLESSLARGIISIDIFIAMIILPSAKREMTNLKILKSLPSVVCA